MSLGAISCQTCGCAQTSCEGCRVPRECETIASCCCPPTHQSWRQARIGLGIRVEYVSTLWMLVEIFGSIGVGLLTKSLALLAFGGDSLIEIISGVAVLAQLRRSRDAGQAKDAGGQERTERLTSALLFLLIPVIALGAAYSYLTAMRPERSALGLAVAGAAVIVMPGLYLLKTRIGEETKTLALSIDAVESLTCFLMSIALLGGLLAEYAFGLWWADYVATAAILVFVTKEAMESLHELRQSG